MKNLNQTQKDYLKTFKNVDAHNELKKMLKKTNKKIVGFTDDQIYCIDNTVYTDSARKKLIKIFREENLMNNLSLSVN